MSDETPVRLATPGGAEFNAVIRQRGMIGGDYEASFSYKGADEAVRLVGVTATELDELEASAAVDPNGVEAKMLAARAAMEKQRDDDRALMEATAAVAEKRRTYEEEARVRRRLEITDEHHERRAQERMEASDARFDAPTSLASVWDDDPIQPTVCAMNNGDCLLYENARNVVYGPSEAGKTWFAILATIQEVKEGRPVVYLDYENGLHGFKDRLKSFGVTPAEADLVRYYPMDGGTPPSPETVAKLAADFAAANGRLVVLDTTTPAMRALGLNPLSETDVETFYVMAADPWIASAGLAWLAVDHTPGADSSKHYGNQQKKSGVTGMSINIIENTRFSRHIAGASDVFIAKDRHGGGPEPANPDRLVARLHVRPGSTLGLAATEGMLELVPLDSAALVAERAATDALKAMHAAASERDRRRRIADWFDAHDPAREGLPKSWIYNGQRGDVETGKLRVQAITGKTVDIRRAIEELTAEGLIVSAAKGITIAPGVNTDAFIGIDLGISDPRESSGNI